MNPLILFFYIIYSNIKRNKANGKLGDIYIIFWTLIAVDKYNVYISQFSIIGNI